MQYGFNILQGPPGAAGDLGGGLAPQTQVTDQVGLFLSVHVLHQGQQFLTEWRSQQQGAGVFQGDLQVDLGDSREVGWFTGNDGLGPGRGRLDYVIDDLDHAAGGGFIRHSGTPPFNDYFWNIRGDPLLKSKVKSQKSKVKSQKSKGMGDL